MSFTTDLQKTVYYNNYSRWSGPEQRRETWPETVKRVMKFFNTTYIQHGQKADIDWHGLEQGMLNLEVLPSMRVVQMAGPALQRCNVGAYNCAYLPLQDWQCFGELLYILMQGTGVGFSVESRYVSRFPTIKLQTGNETTSYFTIPDTTEGWCDALVAGLTAWANGQDIVYDYSQIRPYGSPLHTKGGKSSGPEPLRNLLEFARKMLLAHQGRKLSSLNLHDLACYAGAIVQVGGVRRAAEISLSDLADTKLRGAKQGRFYELYPERGMANNSAVYESRPDMRQFLDEWRELMDSGTGERGIFNRRGVIDQIPARRQPHEEFGVNPCGEIILRPFEFCNLSIAVARPNETFVSMQRKVILATQFGMLQSLLTKFNYIRPEWAHNCNEERLLGVDITGQMDCALFTSQVDDAFHYDNLRIVAVTTAKQLAQQLQINMPAAVTCVKPSGNSSQLLNASSGIHPRYAPYYIRRLRIGSSSGLCRLLEAAGVPHFPEVGQDPSNPLIKVFEFPVKSPDGAVVRGDRTAVEQLEQWLTCKAYWTEHNPSCTVYVREHEWLEVGAWVYKHWNAIGGLSFLPYEQHVYQLAPYEEITEIEYIKRTAQWPEIDFTTLKDYEHADNTELNREFACTGDRCEL